MNTFSQQPEIKTLANLESAFAGESMAHIKYLYFASLARAYGDEETAQIFEKTANEELMHALSHLYAIYPAATTTPAKSLQIAIECETFEFSKMYPTYRTTAKEEGAHAIVREIDEKIEESKAHAAQFEELLLKARKLFSAQAHNAVLHSEGNKAQQTMSSV